MPAQTHTLRSKLATVTIVLELLYSACEARAGVALCGPGPLVCSRLASARSPPMHVHQTFLLGCVDQPLSIVIWGNLPHVRHNSDDSRGSQSRKANLYAPSHKHGATGTPRAAAH